MTEWVHQSNDRIGWISLTDEDSDPITLLTYLVAALQMLEPGMAKQVKTLLQSPNPPSENIILTLLINEIAQISYDFTIVVDDFHLALSQEVISLFQFVLEHKPANMNLILSSRIKPLTCPQ